MIFKLVYCNLNSMTCTIKLVMLKILSQKLNLH